MTTFKEDAGLSTVPVFMAYHAACHSTMYVQVHVVCIYVHIYTNTYDVHDLVPCIQQTETIPASKRTFSKIVW